MSMRLNDKRCLLVGGTGGIGQASVRRFLEEGALVVRAGLPPLADEPPHQRAWSIAADVTQPDQVESLFDQARELLGGIDVLFHIAGRSGRRDGDGPLHQCSLEGWQATLTANLTSTFLTNQAAVRHFLDRQQPGVILNLASVLALAPAPTHFDTCAYTSAKGGIIALSRLAAARYASHGIRVNVLAPGLIDTPMSQRAVGDPAIGRFLRSKQPLARGAGQAEDVADAAVFLCSDEARLLTGVVLPVDGGWCVSEGQFSEPRDQAGEHGGRASVSPEG